MKSLLVFTSALLISVSASAFNDTNNNNDKKSKETLSINRVESVRALQLTGSVVDDNNNEMLAGAAIIVDGKKYYSDLEGQFAIVGVTPGKYEVKVELISYEPYIAEIDLTKDQKLNVSLLQK